MNSADCIQTRRRIYPVAMDKHLTPLSIWLIVAALSFVVLGSAQVLGGSPRPGPAGLVLPITSAPLSAEQIEERTRTLPPGTSSREIVRSTVYRDSAGRMRIESVLAASPGESVPLVSLVDPVAGSIVALVTPAKIAARITVSKSGPDAFAVAFPGIGEMLPAGTWKTKTEGLGKRTIDGVEVEGTRTTQTSEDQPSLIAVEERWFSKNLGLAVLVEASGPNWRHTAKIQKIDYREPDPALFVIPSDYTVRELGSAK